MDRGRENGPPLCKPHFILTEWDCSVGGNGIVMFAPQDQHARNGLAQAGWMQRQVRKPQTRWMGTVETECGSQADSRREEKKEVLVFLG